MLMCLRHLSSCENSFIEISPTEQPSTMCESQTISLLKKPSQNIVNRFSFLYSLNNNLSKAFLMKILNKEMLNNKTENIYNGKKK